MNRSRDARQGNERKISCQSILIIGWNLSFVSLGPSGLLRLCSSKMEDMPEGNDGILYERQESAKRYGKYSCLSFHRFFRSCLRPLEGPPVPHVVGRLVAMGPEGQEPTNNMLRNGTQRLKNSCILIESYLPSGILETLSGPSRAFPFVLWVDAGRLKRLFFLVQHRPPGGPQDEGK